MSRIVHQPFVSSTRFFTVAFAPLKALASGHVTLIFFTIALGAPCWLLFVLIDRVLAQLAAGAEPEQAGLTSAIEILLSGVIWAIGAPLLLAAIVVPFRTLWHHERISFALLFEETPVAIGRAYLACFLCFAGLFLGAILLMGVFTGGRTMLFVQSAPQMQLFLSLALLFIATLAMLRPLMKLLIVPFLSIGCGLSLREALNFAPAILQRRFISVLSLLLIAGSAVGAIYLHFHSPDRIGAAFSVWELVAYAVVLWYFAGSITTFCLAACESFNSDQFRHLRELATPIVVKHHDVRRKREEKPKEKMRRNNADTKGNRSHRETTSLSSGDVELLLR